MALLDDELYVFGGESTEKVVEKYDNTTQSWIVLENGLESNFANGAAIVVN